MAKARTKTATDFSIRERVTELQSQLDQIRDAFEGKQATFGQLKAVANRLRAKARRIGGVGGGMLADKAERILDDAARSLSTGEREPITKGELKEQRRRTAGEERRVVQQAGIAERLDASKARNVARLTATLNEATAGQEIPGILGGKPAADSPQISALQERIRATRGPRNQSRLAATAPSVVQAAQKAGRSRQFVGRGILGGLGGAFLLNKILGGGSSEPQLDPAVQLALAGQLQGGGGGTKRSDLVDVGRLLSILKSLQGLAGSQGPPPTQGLI